MYGCVSVGRGMGTWAQMPVGLRSTWYPGAGVTGVWKLLTWVPWIELRPSVRTLHAVCCWVISPASHNGKLLKPCIKLQSRKVHREGLRKRRKAFWMERSTEAGYTWSDWREHGSRWHVPSVLSGNSRVIRNITGLVLYREQLRVLPGEASMGFGQGPIRL